MVSKFLILLSFSVFGLTLGCSESFNPLGGSGIGSPNDSLSKIELSSSSSEVTISEDNVLALVVVLSRKTISDTSIQWSIENGSGHFTTSSGTVTINEGKSSFTLDITPINDLLYEVGQTYTLSLSGSDKIFKNTLSITVNLNDNDSPLSEPIFTLADPTTSSNSHARQQTVDVALSNDATATQWCLSETQTSRPATASAECVGGSGTQDGWFTSRPTQISLSSSQGSKTLYAWIADVNGNVSSTPSSQSINLDSLLPATPTVSLSDSISGSTTNAYSVTVDLSITDDTDALNWCLIEQAAVDPDPAIPSYNDVCWVAPRPTSKSLAATGNRKVFVFTKDLAENVSSSGGSATINYQLNQNPTAHADSLTLAIGDLTTTSIDVLANDTDPESETLTVTAKTDGSQGTVAITGGGTGLTYTLANGSFYGTDTFTYTIEDPRGGSHLGTVTVRVMTPFTWTGAGVGNSWSTSGNWCGSVVSGACAGGPAPGSSDTAVFNGNCTSNCSAEISAPTTVGNLELSTGFTGTVSQLTGQPLTVSTDYNQTAGTFTGSNAAITINGSMSLTGGSFTSTSATLKIGTYTCTSKTLFTHTASSTFNANSGLVQFAGGRRYNHSCGPTMTISTEAGLQFNDLEIFGDYTTGGWNTVYNSSTGETLVVNGNFTHTAYVLNIPININGDYTVGSYPAGGSGVVTFVGSGNQEYNDTSTYYGSRVAVNKPSGMVTPGIGTTNLYISALDVVTGSFTAPTGDFFLGRYDCTSMNVLRVAAGATFNHNSGHLRISAGRGSTSSCGPTKTLDFQPGFTVHHLTFYGNATAGGWHDNFTSASGDPITVLGHFTHGAGRLNLPVIVHQDISISTNADNGSGSIELVGSGSQTISQTSSKPSTGTFKVNKPSGTATASTSITLNGTGQDFWIAGGTVDLGGNVLTINDQLTIDSGTILNLSGGSHSQGTLVNNGTINP